jgi:phage-related protein
MSGRTRFAFKALIEGEPASLHAFQKKAKTGIATPQRDIELIKSRLRDAELHYRALTERGDRKP